MQCPHCLQFFHEESSLSRFQLPSDAEGSWALDTYGCPACKKLIAYLEKQVQDGYIIDSNDRQCPHMKFAGRTMVRPRGHNKPPAPSEVPPEIAEDYTEACLVLADSPKASAALSRRCLQHVLRDAGGVKPGNLYNEIQEAITGSLPPYIADSIDAVRNIGNFSAHPMKSETTDAILPVEDREAGWNLEVLESLFDFYYVRPAREQAKKDELNKKLKEAGKEPI